MNSCRARHVDDRTNTGFPLMVRGLFLVLLLSFIVREMSPTFCSRIVNAFMVLVGKIQSSHLFSFSWLDDFLLFFAAAESPNGRRTPSMSRKITSTGIMVLRCVFRVSSDDMHVVCDYAKRFEHRCCTRKIGNIVSDCTYLSFM